MNMSMCKSHSTTVLHYDTTVHYDSTFSFTYDTTVLKDSMFVFDTTVLRDSMYVYDTTTVFDSTFVFDTVITHDTVHVYDTSVFLDTVLAMDIEKGIIHGAVTLFKDGNEIIITPGYGECKMEYWELKTPDTLTLTGIPTAEDFVYIYIDDSESDYPTPAFTSSTTEPVYVDSSLGWYNGWDRCIGAVWSPAGADTIKKFVSNSDLVYLYDYGVKKAVSGANPNGSWQTVSTASDYTPLNAIAAFVRGDSKDLNGLSYCGVAAMGCDLAMIYEGTWGGAAAAMGWVNFAERNDSRDIRWFTDSNDDAGSVDIWVIGYKISR